MIRIRNNRRKGKGQPQTQLQCRPALERMVNIHDLLATGRPVKTRRVAQLLEVSSKTIARDLGFMCDRFNLPLEYIPQEHAYRYTAPVDSTIFGQRPTERPETAAASFHHPIEIEHAADLAAIVARYGVGPEFILRSMLREAFMDALDSPRLMDNIVRGARMLAVEGKEAA